MFGGGKYKKVKASDVCDFITKGTTHSSRDISKTYEKDKIPFLKVYNLSFNGTLLFKEEPQYITQEIHTGKLARSKVYPNDILMNIVGPPLHTVVIDAKQSMAASQRKDKDSKRS